MSHPLEDTRQYDSSVTLLDVILQMLGVSEMHFRLSCTIQTATHLMRLSAAMDSQSLR